MVIAATAVPRCFARLKEALEKGEYYPPTGHKDMQV